MNKLNFRFLNKVIAFVVFVIALSTFSLTVEPTASFWDAGEYISTSAKLQIGHPPGAPLFQMLGAVFSILAFENTQIAYAINMMSVTSSALTIVFMFWSVSLLGKKILKVKSENTKVQKILHNLYYDVINIEYNLWSWIRNMTKYGDFYLQLDIVDKYGVVNVTPLSAYDVARLEGHDVENSQNVQFIMTPHQDAARHSTSNPEQVTYENYEIAHFRLLSDANDFNGRCYVDTQNYESTRKKSI